jgi:hypothetical protein
MMKVIENIYISPGRPAWTAHKPTKDWRRIKVSGLKPRCMYYLRGLVCKTIFNDHNGTVEIQNVFIGPNDGVSICVETICENCKMSECAAKVTFYY